VYLESRCDSCRVLCRRAGAARALGDLGADRNALWASVEDGMLYVVSDALGYPSRDTMQDNNLL
jgi:hypothetical protein